jgi:hypothetical protein
MARPVNGSKKFSAQALANLPREGTMNEYGKILGVTQVTIRNWIKHDKTVRLTTRNKVNFLHRDSFIAWLKRTNRFETDPVLDCTEQVKKLGAEAQAFVSTWAGLVPLPAVFVQEFLDVLEAERKRF